jgi:hypothetical protein
VSHHQALHCCLQVLRLLKQNVGLKVYSIEWLLACLKEGVLLNEEDYVYAPDCELDDGWSAMGPALCTETQVSE